MARVSPTEFADKWGRRLKAAGPDIQNGIKRVQTAPGQLAAQQAQTMLTNLAARVNDGSWAKAVSRVSLADWQTAALTKGVGRIAAGVDAAQNKVAAMAGPLLQAVDAAVAETDRTPRGDVETNINRAVTFMRAMARNAPKRNQ